MSKNTSPRGRTGRKRLARAQRRLARGGGPLAAVCIGPDPLVRSARQDSVRGRMLAGFMLAAVAVHGLFTVGVGAIASAFATSERVREESIRVEINPVPPVQPIAAAPPEPEPAATPAREPAVAMKEPPVAKTRPRRRATRSKAVAKEPETHTPPPRRVIGASFSSTVQGGKGPTIAVGNTLDGSTDSVAVDARTISANPGPSTAPKKSAPRASAPGKGNRVASFVPTKGVKVVKPKRTSKVKPNYPPLLKAQGIEANVVVQVKVTAEGDVEAVEIIKGAHEEPFNDAARVAALKERFQPATRNGSAVAFRLTYTYRYRISS